MRSSLAPRRLVASLLALLPLIAAPTPTPTPTPADGELHELMEGLKTNLKTIATSLDTAQGRVRALNAVAEMQRLALQAKRLAPANLEQVAEAERDAHRVAFRREMNGLLVALLALEIELLDGDVEAAMARIVGPLYRRREAAHERFQAAD